MIKISVVIEIEGDEKKEDNIKVEVLEPEPTESRVKHLSGAYMIREMRKSQNMSQWKLAHLVGTPRDYISRIENRRIPLTVKMAKRIAKALGCDWKVFR